MEERIHANAPALAQDTRFHREQQATLRYLRPLNRAIPEDQVSALQNRLLRPLLDANKTPARIEIRRALTTLEHAVADYVHNARLAPAP